jgi:rhodanese-related sulfurtransferase
MSSSMSSPPAGDRATSTTENAEHLLARARQRARELGLNYAGALLPAEAHALLQQMPSARLLDVRTKAEWEWIGQVPGASKVEWNTWPGGQRNPAFIEELRATLPEQTAPLLLLCRSGGRSSAAAEAATRAGYSLCINILEGFEGDKDSASQRNRLGGWRHAGLPWVQS